MRPFIATLLLACVSIIACSDDNGQDCAATKTCVNIGGSQGAAGGDGGMGAQGGAGAVGGGGDMGGGGNPGGGGSGGMPECTDHPDCTEADNAQCDNGTCVPAPIRPTATVS